MRYMICSKTAMKPWSHRTTEAYKYHTCKRKDADQTVQVRRRILLPRCSHICRQIHASVCYYQYSFFPKSVVLWDKLPADHVLVSDIDSFKTGVSKINHVNP